MKLMKHILHFRADGKRRTATIVMLLFSALACACGGRLNLPSASGSEPPVSVGVTELTLYYPVQVDGQMAQLIEDLATQFNSETPGVSVSIDFTGNYSETLDKLTASMIAGNPPDLVILDTPQLLTMIASDMVEPLDDFIFEDGGYSYINDFFPGFMVNSVYEGKIYSIPFQRSALLMYYNKDHFREAGLNPDRPPQTWHEMAEYAQRLTKTDPDGNTRWGILIPEGVYNLAPFILSNSAHGENLMAPDGKKALFYSPENVEAVQYLIDLSSLYGAAPKEPMKQETAAPSFIDGKASIVQMSSGNLAAVHNRANFDYGVAMLPKSKRFASIAGGGNIHMVKNTDMGQKRAAWRFIRWVTQPERQAQWNVDTGYIAARKSAFETTIMESYYREVPEARAAYNQLDTCYSGFCVFEAGRLSSILEGYIRRAMSGELSADEALAAAQKEADSILTTYR